MENLWLREGETVEDFQKAIGMGDLYLLQNCNGGFIGNSPLFWRKDNSGYTQWIDEARMWTKEEAETQIRSTRGSHSWKMWSVEEINSVAKRIVDIQDLNDCRITCPKTH